MPSEPEFRQGPDGTTPPRMDLQTHIAKAAARRRELEHGLAQFDFKAGDATRRLQELNRERQRLERILELWASLDAARRQAAEARTILAAEADPDLLALARQELAEAEACQPRIERDLKAAILPPLPYEGRDAILEIRPAAGGDEAGLFAADLYRLYTRYAEQRGWTVELLELASNDVGGLKEAILAVRGADAFRQLAYESGVHRVQRVPATEAAGRIHTSTVTVAVLPEAEEVDLEIRPEELHFEACRASGAGGQYVNRTDSAVRVTHLPTGLAVFSQQERSQHKNRDIALRLLRTRLLQRRRDAEAARYAAARKSQVGTGERSERIRTYNFPQNRVTDHRFDLTWHDLPAILSGERFHEFIEEIRGRDVERRLAEELA